MTKQQKCFFGENPSPVDWVISGLHLVSSLLFFDEADFFFTVEELQLRACQYLCIQQPVSFIF